MEFSFSSKVEKISEFYKSMRQLSVQIGTFEHKYNHVTSDVIFDTRNEKQWNLLFIKRGSGKGQFSIKEFVLNLNIQIPNEYKLSDNKRRIIINYDKLDSANRGNHCTIFLQNIGTGF